MERHCSSRFLGGLASGLRARSSCVMSSGGDFSGHASNRRRLMVPSTNASRLVLPHQHKGGHNGFGQEPFLLHAQSSGKMDDVLRRANNPGYSGVYSHDDLSKSATTRASMTEALGVDTDLGKDVSNVPNPKLSHYRALVLDVSYRPLDTLPWTRAVVLDYFDKVDVLEYYDSFVRSARDYHYLPAVIRVKFYVKKLKGAFDKGVPLTRKNVYARDRHECQYCSSKKNLTLDHVIPTSKGGGTTWENLVTACGKCNQKKGDKLLKELRGTMKLKKQPRQPSHYEMSSYMVARQGQGSTAPKEWRDYLPPGTAEWVFSDAKEVRGSNKDSI